MSNTYAVMLTELGVIVTGDGEPQKMFAFENPVQDYLEIKSGRIPKSCTEMCPYLESLNSTIHTGDESLLAILKKELVDAQMLEGRAAEQARESKQGLIISSGLASDQRDATARLRDFAMGLSSSRVTEVSSSPDLHVIQAVNSLDETDKVANALSSRMREWYGLHFPELENLIDSIEGYARIVMTGRRDVLTPELLEGAGFPSQKSEVIIVASSNSRGGSISDESLDMVQAIAGQLVALYDLRRRLEALIEKEMSRVAPNLSAILGTSLCARMLARIGSMNRMATLPASTIQVLGAERALFRSLKTGSHPPKHGLLFQHPLVHAAPRWQRGKIARAIAAKAVIAARVDVYSGGDNNNSDGEGLNRTLLEKLNIRIGEIEEKFQEPTPKSGESHQAGGPYTNAGGRAAPRGGSRSDYGAGRRSARMQDSGGRRPEWARKRSSSHAGRGRQNSWDGRGGDDSNGRNSGSYRRRSSGPASRNTGRQERARGNKGGKKKNRSRRR